MKKFFKLLSAMAAVALAVSAVPCSLSVGAAENYYSYCDDMLEAINKVRAQNGLSPVKLNISLCDAANVRAVEIKTKFDHVRPNGTDCNTAVDALNLSYTYINENIALGQLSVNEVMNDWLNSSGHRSNILEPSVNEVGIGISGTAWVQMFTASLKGSYTGKGDTNYDGRITATDAADALEYYSYQATYDCFTELDEFIKAADYNNDGKVTPVDASLILTAYANNST